MLFFHNIHQRREKSSDELRLWLLKLAAAGFGEGGRGRKQRRKRGRQRRGVSQQSVCFALICSPAHPPTSSSTSQSDSVFPALCAALLLRVWASMCACWRTPSCPLAESMQTVLTLNSHQAQPSGVHACHIACWTLPLMCTRGECKSCFHSDTERLHLIHFMFLKSVQISQVFVSCES